MKKYFILFSILLTSNLFSQIKEDLIMAIYPGCEHTKEDKKVALSCFSQKFGEDLAGLVTYKNSISEKNDKNEYVDVAAKIYFTITKEGKLNVTKVDSPDESFNKMVKQSVILLDKYLEQENKRIQPASLDGKPVALNLSIPINKNYK